MFTGIIEDLGTISDIKKEDKNLHLFVKSTFTNELTIDQSVAHNGICLTVVAINGDEYQVTAIDETIQKTNIANYKPGDCINLERAMILGSRLDGHIVQGHVDSTAICTKIDRIDGSTLFTIEYPPNFQGLVIEKGSICVNGISLTAFNCNNNTFTVAIIPYTFEHTNLKYLKVEDKVNIEYDIIGKYILRQQH
jgi:riboflavin synthase